jgi:hypothetical protein
MSKRIIIQSPLLPNMALAEVPDGATEDAVRRAALEAIPTAQRSKDLEVTFESSDDEADTGGGKSQFELVDGMRVHVSRCKKVAVTVRYFGKTPKSREFAPAVRVKVVKDWAVKAFELSPTEAARHSLRLPDVQEELSGDVQIGSLVVQDTCGVTLDLVPSDRINGDR